jgi:aryl-alcohol dehydrogenase-like predicted oxidoreductase
VIIAARKVEQLEDNIRAVDLQLSDENVLSLATTASGWVSDDSSLER